MVRTDPTDGNPFIQPQTVRLTLDGTTGCSAGEAGNGIDAASIVFPYCETLRQRLRFGDALGLERK